MPDQLDRFGGDRGTKQIAQMPTRERILDHRFVDSEIRGARGVAEDSFLERQSSPKEFRRTRIYWEEPARGRSGVSYSVSKIICSGLAHPTEPTGLRQASKRNVEVAPIDRHVFRKFSDRDASTVEKGIEQVSFLQCSDNHRKNEAILMEKQLPLE
jgi:hypothetical protein